MTRFCPVVAITFPQKSRTSPSLITDISLWGT